MANGSFDGVVCKMREHLEQLKNCKLATPGKNGNFPSNALPSVKDEVKGVYCFYENGKPLYVGRSRNLKERVLTHRRQSSRHNAAQFAFNIARKKFEKNHPCEKLSREGLSNNDEFACLFKKAKTRVRKMSVRFVEIKDPIEQAVFEVYAHMELGTEFNDFNTH